MHEIHLQGVYAHDNLSCYLAPILRQIVNQRGYIIDYQKPLFVFVFECYHCLVIQKTLNDWAIGTTSGNNEVSVTE